MSKVLKSLFFLLPVYWGYLLFTTQPVIIFDAVGYQDLGRLLYEKGLGEYFRSGPYREPLFPFLISVAMHLEHWTAIAYPYFLKGILFAGLAIAMFGVYRLVRLLSGTRNAAGIAAFLVGVSPSILNSTLWLWSEAASYPFVVWGLVGSIKLWQYVNRCEISLWKICGIAAAVAASFVGFAMSKAVAATVFVFFILPFAVAALVLLIRKDRRAVRLGLAVAVMLVVHGAGIQGYKLLNKLGSGQFVFTNRGDYALFGNTVRRLQPLTGNRLAEAWLAAPRLGICEKYYGADCAYWGYLTSDKIIEQAEAQMAQFKYTPEQKEKIYIESSIKLMKEHPFQQALLMLVEATKMLYWENRVYFVKYAEPLKTLYANTAFVLTLCFTAAFLSLAGFLYGLFRAVHGEDRMRFLLVTGFIVFFTGFYSLFFIDIRYGLPQAPVFVVLAAVALNRMVIKLAARRTSVKTEVRRNKRKR